MRGEEKRVGKGAAEHGFVNRLESEESYRRSVRRCIAEDLF